MAATVPPPPILAPLSGLCPGITAPNSVTVRIFQWAAPGTDQPGQTGNVTTIPLPYPNQLPSGWWFHDAFQAGWQFWPAGYYASAKDPLGDGSDWAPDSRVFLVVDRVDTFANPQPHTIPDPVSLDGSSPSDQCPAGMALSGYEDPYIGLHGTMCNWLAPPAMQICPPGTHWDPTTETCIADTAPMLPVLPVPPGPPPPPDAPPGPVSQPEDDGDSITNTLCAQMAANAAAIVAAINALNRAAPGPGQEACCKAIVAAIAALNTSLNAIFNLLTSKGLTFAPVNNFAPAITIDVPPAAPPQVIVNEAPFDQEYLAKLANDPIGLLAKVQAYLDNLVSEGILTPDELQVITS